MASAPELGLLKVYAQSPTGERKLLFQGRTEVWGPGGAPDGVPANATIDKWMTLPLSPFVLTGGWKIINVCILDAADGIDVSDCFTQLPIHVRGKGMRHLNYGDLNMVDLAAATTADVEHDLGTGYEVPNGEQVRVGGGPMCMYLEDDTG